MHAPLMLARMCAQATHTLFGVNPGREQGGLSDPAVSGAQGRQMEDGCCFDCPHHRRHRRVCACRV
eukprot:1158058-Pelagomonas_calceolata.AAC.2